MVKTQSGLEQSSQKLENRLENLISQKIDEAFEFGKDYVHMVNRKDIDVDASAARIMKKVEYLKAELLMEAGN